jgi:hypothetical protein
MESPHEELTAAMRSSQYWFAVHCRPQCDGDGGAGSRLVADQCRYTGSIAVQAILVGRYDLAEMGMSWKQCHPECGSVPSRQNTTCSGFSVHLAHG